MTANAHKNVRRNQTRAKSDLKSLVLVLKEKNRKKPGLGLEETGKCQKIAVLAGLCSTFSYRFAVMIDHKHIVTTLRKSNLYFILV